MPVFKELQRKDGLWFIKWIDQIRLPHAGTESASVTAVLQKLPHTDIKQIRGLTPKDLWAILGTRKGEPEPIIHSERVLAGLIPELYVGGVYRNGGLIGNLPWEREKIHLNHPQNRHTDLSLDQEVEPPPGWGANFPCKPLNRAEYSRFTLTKSRALLVSTPGEDFLIPRMVIFRTFYGVHTALANAFCNGPWSQTIKSIVSFHDFESGLKTEVDAKTGMRKVILQRDVPYDYAPLVALHYFDDYAKRLADSIYSLARQEASETPDEHWHANASIPFRMTDQAFYLKVRGFQLKTFGNPDKPGYRKKFLVTAITHSTWPNYIPETGWEKATSGEAGDTKIVSDEPPPFWNAKKTRDGDRDAQIASDKDPKTDSPANIFRSGEFSWLDPQPKREKLRKTSSKDYRGGVNGNGDNESGNSDTVSAGNENFRQEAPDKAKFSTVHREPERRFEQMISGLNLLVKQGAISQYQIYPPSDARKLVGRGDLDCWSFLNKQSQDSSRIPKRGWRVILPTGSSPAFPRAALVCRVMLADQPLYLIEIEVRPTESGFRTFFLVTQSSISDNVIDTTLQLIARDRGSPETKELAQAIKAHGVDQVGSYVHQFVRSEHEETLDTGSLLRCLEKLASVS